MRTELTHNDFASPTALKLKEIYQHRLDFLRRQNDGTTLDERKTATIRGRIAEVKNLLKALGEKDQAPPVTDDAD